MLEKNSETQVLIETLGSEAQGIGRVDGMAVFVPFALPGELVRAVIIKREKRYAVAKLLEIVETAGERVAPRCPQFARCGGCAMQHMAYDAQLRCKKGMLIDALERIGGVGEASSIVREVIGMDAPWRYRNKAAFPVAPEGDGVAIGLYARRSHRVIPLADCPIQDESTVAALRIVGAWARQWGVGAYDEARGVGFLRHVVARTSAACQSMVVIVTNDAPGAPFPHESALVQALREGLAGIASIVRNHNQRRDNVIFGERFETIWGVERIDETIAGLRFAVSAETFLQVNPTQTESLYAAALEAAALTGTERVVDCYCGMGSMTLIFAQKARDVLGIEIVPRAVEDARENASRNGIDNARFLCAPAETALPDLVANGEAIDLIVLDPPRKGCEKALLDAVIASQCPRLVYVSCDPGTLARDVAILRNGGYALESVQPVDMFPQTQHVECVSLLTKSNVI